MSKKALDFLVRCELLNSNGTVVDLSEVANSEISRRLSEYISLRKSNINSEVNDYSVNSKLSAQYSTGSSKFSKSKTLSSLLIYDRVVLNDPLVFSREFISSKDLNLGLAFFSWLFPLIKNDLVFVYPIDFYDKPSNDVPLWISEDSFKSSISPVIHDFAHDNAIIKSVISDENGEMLVLSEDACIKRRTALNIDFREDALYYGVSLFLFKTIEDVKKLEDGTFQARQVWDSKGVLSKERFDSWAYQATNQAVIARLKTIYNQISLANKLGHTYITESKFESKLLSLSNNKNVEEISPVINFMKINEEFIKIDSPYTILKLRESNASTFDRFNASLLSISSELSECEPEDFENKSKIIFQRDVMPQVDEVRGLIGRINSGFTTGVLASLGSIAFAINTGSAMPLIPSIFYTIAAGATGTLPAISDFNQAKKRPSYIWHKLVN